MKVFCINDDGWCQDVWKPVVTSYFFGLKIVTEQKQQTIASDGPEYGDICTVIGEVIEDGLKFYLLKEWPLDEEGYQSNQFVPIEAEKIESKKEKLTETNK